ncbi:ribokinase [Pseudanabaena sp. PCC 6802]|uniref:ribokinase n=1 Tax=Pseudanabaena sp. PCC 6802 TaxID=118173 RepID=UPI00034C7FC1|nr:ribokinase [Pseudanabaena sp. PCC 6802]
MSVIVLGSINTDFVVKVNRLPIAGETIDGYDLLTAAGGKGANQAVAAARLGAQTHMVGRVGRDRFGPELCDGLQSQGVQIAHVSVDERSPSGTAMIMVDRLGENQIAIVAGANGNVGQSDVENMIELLPYAKVLLMQLEIPLNTVELAGRLARANDIPVILDPAPAPTDIPAWLFACIDIITPNEIEASQLLRFPVHDRETAIEAALALVQMGAGTAIVKLGGQGAVCATADETFFMPAFPIRPVDMVAAGDAFNGAMAAAIAAGLTLKQALVWGAAAGALCATKSGAQAAMPTLDELTSFLEQHRHIVPENLSP